MVSNEVGVFRVNALLIRVLLDSSFDSGLLLHQMQAKVAFDIFAGGWSNSEGIKRPLYGKRTSEIFCTEVLGTEGSLVYKILDARTQKKIAKPKPLW